MIGDDGCDSADLLARGLDSTGGELVIASLQLVLTLLRKSRLAQDSEERSQCCKSAIVALERADEIRGLVSLSAEHTARVDELEVEISEELSDDPPREGLTALESSFTPNSTQDEISASRAIPPPSHRP